MVWGCGAQGERRGLVVVRRLIARHSGRGLKRQMVLKLKIVDCDRYKKLS